MKVPIVHLWPKFGCNRIWTLHMRPKSKRPYIMQTCQPLGSQNCILKPKKLYFSLKNCILYDGMKTHRQFWKTHTSILGTQNQNFRYKISIFKIYLRFSRYRHFSVAQNNKIQRKLNTIIDYTSKSIFPTSDSFCLIASQIVCRKTLRVVPIASLTHMTCLSCVIFKNLGTCITKSDMTILERMTH